MRTKMGATRALLAALGAVAYALPVRAPSGWKVVYPTPGTNDLRAGGGGPCTYTYLNHRGTPVVSAAHCVVSFADMDKGSETTPTTKRGACNVAALLARLLSGAPGCAATLLRALCLGSAFTSV